MKLWWGEGGDKNKDLVDGEIFTGVSVSVRVYGGGGVGGEGEIIKFLVSGGTPSILPVGKTLVSAFHNHSKGYGFKPGAFLNISFAKLL